LRRKKGGLWGTEGIRGEDLLYIPEGGRVETARPPQRKRKKMVWFKSLAQKGKEKASLKIMLNRGGRAWKALVHGKKGSMAATNREKITSNNLVGFKREGMWRQKEGGRMNSPRPALG